MGRAMGVGCFHDVSGRERHAHLTHSHFRWIFSEVYIFSMATNGLFFSIRESILIFLLLLLLKDMFCSSSWQMICLFTYGRTKLFVALRQWRAEETKMLIVFFLSLSPPHWLDDNKTLSLSLNVYLRALRTTRRGSFLIRVGRPERRRGRSIIFVVLLSQQQELSGGGGGELVCFFFSFFPVRRGNRGLYWWYICGITRSIDPSIWRHR